MSMDKSTGRFTIQLPDATAEGLDTGRSAPLTVPELAAELRIGRNSAYNMVRSGQIRSVRIGRNIRIPRDAVDSFLAGAR